MDAVDFLTELARETRDDVKRLLEGQAALEQRVEDLERRVVSVPPPPAAVRSGLARDAGLTAGAGAMVAAVVTVLQALGVLPAPGATAPPHPPATVSAPAK